MLTAARPVLDELLGAVADLAPCIRAAQPYADRERHLPDALLAALVGRGLFRLWLPAALGGLELDAPSAIRAIEAVATIDGSTGWCLGPGNVGNLLAGYLPEAAARVVFDGEPSVFTAGSVAGAGRAVTVDGGYRVSGRWAFATNSNRAPWLLGLCTITDGETPRHRLDGAPDQRLFFFPAEAASVLPTWDAGGLRGTASDDIAVEDTFVPEGYSVAMDAAAWAPGPLFREGPFCWAAPLYAAVPLGIARAAIDALTDLAGAKTPTGGRGLLREQPLIRYELARAEARLRAARAFFYGAVEGVWEALVAGEMPTVEEKALLGLACGHAADASREVAEAMYRAGGGTTVYTRSALDRCLRDVHVATQHAALGTRQYEQAARAFLGMPPGSA